ncbi:hypothetical protein Tco_1556483, partial [Tanacetum coccineum]
SDMAEFNKPKWQLPLVFQMKDRCSEKQNEDPCRDVHQVGDEREVEALSSLNLPPRLLMNGGKVVRSLQRLLEMESSEVISLQVRDC